jgi:predicted metal-dependent HD superfamily phosphohydrolase
MSTFNPSAPRQADHVLRGEMLRDRFSALWRACLATGASDDAEAVWSALDKRYSEPHRFYHDAQHIAYCLEQLDLAIGEVNNPAQLEMAIWFHDVVYDLGSQDNEARSTGFFRVAADGKMPRAFVDAVVGLILATQHNAVPRDLDQQFICDIDLASFGYPWTCYMRDSAAVKAEFQGPDEEYRRGKKAFLNALLARPRIFVTDFFNALYEQRARDNIRRLLELVEQRRA